MPRDCIYFGEAFQEMERQSQAGGLRVYTTYDWNSLPEYGVDVVVLLLGEEIGRVPRYIRHVRAVFKTMRTHPYLGIRKWKFDALRLSLLLKAMRDWPEYWKSLYLATHTPRQWPPRVRDERTCLDVPLGYLNRELLPRKTMQERPFDCFFAGQIAAPKKGGWLGLMPLPKNESRKRMLAALEEVKQHHDEFSFDGLENREVGEESEGVEHTRRGYSQRMMDAKFCLAPRGNVVDTFRFFEGMYSGCVVVCEPLPRERYYADAPIIQINDWSELERSLLPLLSNDEAIEKMSSKTLDWWKEKCSEIAIGRDMAQAIDG